MQRITLANVEGAFKRLHSAMNWPKGGPYDKKAGKWNIGAVYLAETGYGFAIEEVATDGGGIRTLYSGWSTKREAFNAMADMACAVGSYKTSSHDDAS